ncbi:NADPH:quinone reductase-like Zn-dependent oxidoreductase [Microbacterium resistens]|uniref:NADPH:quinone reductase-like Zn-dependent oxidoreductase n=1 Tax=Microbacterium resistens TaxID=156977 RepID=A0ABU1SBX1_9MICO|nr:NADP-dependent oxidoreductase [Microbacterium resistens]MDR6866392.1 NADPH:quinone reductase-like Zn-dependent oxidoreductase [Microbacterium resistens]
MRSATYSGPGAAADVISIADEAVPVPGPTEVIVRVAAAGLNPVDVKIRAAAVDFGPIEYSDRPGWDVAGTITALGADVHDWAVGDTVFALAGFPRAAHTLAEYAAVPAADLAAVPSGWSLAQAGAAPLAALTAWQALDAAGVGAPGTATTPRVLVLGGAGGVGHLAIQLAKARGARVLATASPAKHELLQGLGVDEVIDYRDEEALAAIGPVDAVIVTVDDTLPPRGAVVPGTAVVTITGYSDDQQTTLAGWGADPVARILVVANGSQLAEIAGLATAGKVTVHLDSEYSLDDLAAAQERVESGRVTGKVVVILPEA